MKKKKYLLLILLIFFFKISYTNASIQNKIIATVNNEIITSYELKNKIMTFLILNKVEVNQENINNYKNQSISPFKRLYFTNSFFLIFILIKVFNDWFL